MTGTLIAAPDDLTGKKAKDFTLPVVGEDREITLSGYKNKKIVIVHFWKSRWRECVAALPQLAEIQSKYKDKPVQLLSINAINREGKVAADKEHFKINYPVLLGRGTKVILDYNLVSLPKIMIIDHKGTIAFSASNASKSKMIDVVDTLLNEFSGEKESTKTKSADN